MSLVIETERLVRRSSRIGEEPELVGASFSNGDSSNTLGPCAKGSTRPRAEAKRPPSRWQRAPGTTGAAGRCLALPPGGTIGEGALKPARLTCGHIESQRMVLTRAVREARHG